MEVCSTRHQNDDKQWTLWHVLKLDKSNTEWWISSKDFPQLHWLVVFKKFTLLSDTEMYSPPSSYAGYFLRDKVEISNTLTKGLGLRQCDTKWKGQSEGARECDNHLEDRESSNETFLSKGGNLTDSQANDYSVFRPERVSLSEHHSKPPRAHARRMTFLFFFFHFLSLVVFSLKLMSFEEVP